MRFYHEPMLVVDDTVEGTIVKCRECGKILWYPTKEDECKPEPPPLGINVSEGVGTKDRFGR